LLAEEEDPELENMLRDADSNYDAAATEADKAIHEAVEEKFKQATQQGDLTKAKLYQDLLEKCRDGKQLPAEPTLQAARSAYDRAIGSASKARIAVYDEVIKKYTQKQCIQRAGDVRRRRDQLAQDASAKVLPGRYILRNRASGLTLAIEDDARVAGARVVQTQFRPDGFHEWTIADLGEGWFSIRNGGSGMSLAVPDASQDKGTGCIQHPFDPGCLDHNWKIEAVGGGFYRIVNKSAGQCLGVPGASKEIGKQAIQWPWNPEAFDHYWRLEKRP
jgi:hypothetical protein